MLKFTIKTSVHSLLHVSVHLDHLQGAYGDSCKSDCFVGLSVKYIVKSYAVLWQHLFDAAVFIEWRAVCDGTRYTKHMLPQQCKAFNDVFY
jgi:hypothetical protein